MPEADPKMTHFYMFTFMSATGHHWRTLATDGEIDVYIAMRYVMERDSNIKGDIVPLNLMPISQASHLEAVKKFGLEGSLSYKMTINE